MKYLHTFLLLPLVIGTVNARAQITVEASRNITSGCVFGATANGELGQTANMQTLSTAASGGTRPSLSFTVINGAVLSQVPGLKWRHGSADQMDVMTQSALMTSATGGTPITLPATFNSSGTHTYHLEISGTHSSKFQMAGQHKASATFNCI